MRFSHALPVAALLATACGSPAAPDTTPLETPVVPLNFAWLGTYDGSAEGTDRGTAFEDRAIRVTLTLSRAPGCAETVAIRVEGLFDACGFVFTSAIAQSFTYSTDSTVHALSLERFSGGGQTGNVLRGTLRVGWTDTTRTSPRFLAGFTAVRQ